MFSMCSRGQPTTPTHGEAATGTNGKQIKGGYLCRYKRQLCWWRWVEEWVVLYDDSTMAWYTEEGGRSPASKVLVKEAPEMLAISNWTSQVPKRPPIPEDCSVSHLIALGSRRKRSKVYWMCAKTEQEVAEWIAAITKTLPPAPQIELIVDKPHLAAVVRRPLVRIRPATTAEITGRSTSRRQVDHLNEKVRTDAAIAILTKGAQDMETKGTLACALPWGHGWGWSTLPNGVWNGGLTWSQSESHFTLHAMPTTHCTNLYEFATTAMYHADVGAGGAYDIHSGAASAGCDDLGGDDFDYAMDCGDFVF